MLWTALADFVNTDIGGLNRRSRFQFMTVAYLLAYFRWSLNLVACGSMSQQLYRPPWHKPYFWLPTYFPNFRFRFLVSWHYLPVPCYAMRTLSHRTQRKYTKNTPLGLDAPHQTIRSNRDLTSFKKASVSIRGTISVTSRWIVSSMSIPTLNALTLLSPLTTKSLRTSEDGCTRP